MKEERSFHVMIRELCNEEGISIQKLSFDWILQLTKNGEVRHIVGNNFDLNSEAAGKIAGDKYATYEVLGSQGVPVIKHTMLFNTSTMPSYVADSGNYVTALNEFLKYGKVVIKPNNGCQGQGVTLCSTMKEVEVAIQKSFKIHNSISICPYYDIDTEFRCFYLDGNVKLIYGKTKPFVVGDGESSLGTLVDLSALPDKKIVQDNISSLDLSYVPAKGEKVNLSWKHNLSGGATPKILDKSEDLYSRIEGLALQAGKAMNISFATIDVIKTTDDQLYVLEINSGVCSTLFVEHIPDGYAVMKEIYRKALLKLFE